MKQTIFVGARRAVPLLLYVLIAHLSTPAAHAACTGTSYPSGLDTFTDVVTKQTIASATHNKIQCAIEKIEAELGTLPKGSYADVKTRLNDAVYFAPTRPANTFLGGPTTGADASPAFRALVAGDIPSLDAAKITTGVFALARGGTNQASWTAARCVRVNAGGTSLEAAAADCGGGGGAGDHNFLSTTHLDTLAASPVLGDLIAANSTPAWARVAGNITTAKQFLSQTGTGTVSAAPAWAALADADIPDTITLTNITQITNRAISNTTGTLLEDRGGTAQTTYTLGNILYSSATNTLAKLAGNITTTKQFLSQTGTGAASAAPAWFALTDADIPDILTLSSPTISGTIGGTYNIGGTPTLTSALNLNAQTLSGDVTFSGNIHLPGAGGIFNTSGFFGIGTTTPTEKVDIVNGVIKVQNTDAGIGFHMRNPSQPPDKTVAVGLASPVIRLAGTGYAGNPLVDPVADRVFDLAVEPLALNSGVANPWRFVIRSQDPTTGLITNRLELLAKGSIIIYDRFTTQNEADTKGVDLFRSGGVALVDNSGANSPYLALTGHYDANAAVGTINKTDYIFSARHIITTPTPGTPTSRLAFKSDDNIERFSVWNSGNVALGGITNFTGVTAPGLVLPNDAALWGQNSAGTSSLKIVSINVANKLVTGLWTWPVADGAAGRVPSTDGSGALSFDLINYAALQNVSATNRLLGRSSAGAGIIEEITVGGDITQSGSTFTIAAGSISNSKFRASGALAVVGRAANTAGDVADIQATATSGAVLRESGSALSFGTVATAGIADAAVTYAKIQNVTDARLLGRSSGSAGPPIEITVGAGLSLAAGALATALTDADVPDTITLTNLTQITNRAIADTTGTLALARGGTNQTAWTANRCVRVNAGGTALDVSAEDCATGGGTSHNLLSATHPDTVGASPVLGDMLYGNATPAWTKVAGNITTAKQFLSQTGTGAVSAAPAWAALVDADIPDTITLTNITQITNRAISDTTGTLALARGGTNQTGWTADRCVRVNAGGTALEAAAGDCTTGAGDNVTVNGVAAADADFDDATPAAPSDGVNVRWQKDALTPNNISANLQFATASLAGALSTAAQTIAGQKTFSGGIIVRDNNTEIQDDVDNTKKLVFQLSAITTATTRTWTVPDASGEVSLLGQTISDAEVDDTITLTNITQITNRAIADTTGTLLEARGGTAQTTYTLGDLLYSSATNTLAKLAGNTTTAKQFLSQTGTGTVSAAPTWAALADADIPDTITLTNLTQITNRAIADTTGTLALARGGTNQTAWTAERCVRVNAGGTALESATADCGAGGSGTTITTVRKTADQSSSSIALANVTYLSFSVAASTNYIYEFVVFYTSAALTTGISLAINGPAAPTEIQGGVIIGADSNNVYPGAFGAYNSAITSARSNGGTASVGKVEGIFRNGTTAGTLDLRFATEVSTSAVTINAGSFGRIHTF